MTLKKFPKDEFFDFFNTRHEALTFDDVSLKPARSRVVPRDVSLESFLTPEISLHIPILSADMDTVTEADMAIRLAMEGGLGFLWKSPDIGEQVDWVHRVKYSFNAMIDKPITVYDYQRIKDVHSITAKYENRFSSFVVLNREGRVVGLLTRDRSQFAREKDLVKDFMVENPHTTTKTMGVDSAYRYMKKHRIAKLIVVGKDRELKGLYTFQDVRQIVEGRTPMFNRDEKGRLRVGANVGVNDFKRVERLLKADCDVLLVGTAHGDSDNVINTIKEIRKIFRDYDFGLVAGNVATYEGAVNLIKAGADTIKIGIGSGTICTTRIVAGVGVPQLTAVYDCSKAARRYGKKAIADGGIRGSGDIVKALVAGADSVMMGGVLASTNEAPGKIITDKNGARFKVYRGMGSLGAMIENQTASRYQQQTTLAEKLVPEGIEGAVPLKGSLSEVVYQLVGGIKSGFGYVGARNLRELVRKAVPIKITSAGVAESHPHDVLITKEAPNYTGR